MLCSGRRCRGRAFCRRNTVDQIRRRCAGLPMNAAELFVRCLEAESVEYVFGVPGEENAHFMLALEQSQSIRFVLARHEQGAAFMADAYGRLTGRPAVCLGTLGPGATNLVTGVADANMDHGPVLALTGQGGTFRQHKESPTRSWTWSACSEPITKWATHQVHRRRTRSPRWSRKAVQASADDREDGSRATSSWPEDIAKLDDADAEVRADVRRSFRDGPGPDDRTPRQGPGGDSQRGAAHRARRQRLHPSTREQAAADLRGADRDWRHLHLHGQGRGRPALGAVSVHDRTPVQGLAGPRDRRRRSRDHTRLRPRRVPPAPVERARRQEADRPHRLPSGGGRPPLRADRRGRRRSRALAVDAQRAHRGDA